MHRYLYSISTLWQTGSLEIKQQQQQQHTHTHAHARTPRHVGALEKGLMKEPATETRG